MRRILSGIPALALLLALVYAINVNYNAYTDLIIEQQQQHLLVTSRAVSQNLDLFLSEQLRDIEILIRTPGFVDEFSEYYAGGSVGGLKGYVTSYMLANHKCVSRIYLMDKHGSKIFHYNQYPFIEEFDDSRLELQTISMGDQNGIAQIFPISENHYSLALVNTIYSGSERLGTVVSIVDMEDLYNQYVAALSDHSNDYYIMVKDAEGRVIMHPDEEYIGINYLEYAEANTNPEYASMRKMLAQQYEYEEGAARYRAFPIGERPPGVQITAYTRMNQGGTSWFISAVMPLENALEPAEGSLRRFGLLIIVFLLIVTLGLLTIYYLQKNHQRLELRAKYLQDINSTLEELSQSREQVRHYQRLQTIGALTGGISHEFNNLLTPIMGYCEFIREQLGGDSEYYEDLDEIYKAAARAKEIIEQILPLSRREIEETHHTVVSMDAIINDTLKMVRMVLPSSIQMVDRIAVHGVNVYGNATQLGQVLLNLCTNAYQSMENDGGILTVSASAVMPGELPEAFDTAGSARYVSISVTDTGCGMDSETMSKIFDPFFTTKGTGEGTGLGLSLVQATITNHGGYIEVDSAPGEGSRFSVYLPVTSLPVTAVRKKKAVRPSARLQPIRLMLIDDEARLTKYLKKRLEKHGYPTDVFADTASAEAGFIASPERWDVMIVDYTMPKCKGTTLARRVKELRPGMPILLITGFVETDAIQMKQAGILDEISIKPLDFEELVSKINRLAEGDGQ